MRRLPARPSRSAAGPQAGFSLLELAVVVAVLGVLAVSALSAFDNLGQARQHTAARAHAEAARQALHAFALRNKRLPCPDGSATGDYGREAAGGTCAAGANVGWLPYESLGLATPVRGERLRYGVHRGTGADLVAPPRASADQPDLEGSGGFAAALARAATAAPSTTQPHYRMGGSPDCSATATGSVVNPAFVLVAPVSARDGDSAGGFDGSANRAFATGSGTCVTPPDYPGEARYDDVVVAESAASLLGWLTAATR
ncbi:prepilin-type N-terminal cleavage/methylation domain-containing protein [Stenotrophomonas mori]|uniref:Prepilin-type N-terminal cleavage/methylation domain-containing protein n=1 Tax=Stenotrophomonas mori TaxID=2871096 RepID=A0ABT0SIL2_9GAMM|nr:prepilin-type N-terminal cleavage/methylation domain-containing protein [Stenotrophomonas mori]MCL7715155.1 prepilin-type N-terminal cleavage/methylation domain-containing protein [Stenotrophomonas mori]